MWQTAGHLCFWNYSIRYPVPPSLLLHWELHEGRGGPFHQLEPGAQHSQYLMNNQPSLDHQLYLGHQVRHKT